MAQPGVQVVKADQNQYEVKSHTKDGTLLTALRPTKIMTNATPMAQPSAETRQKGPRAPGRCADAAFYPTKLVLTMLRAMQAIKDVAKSSNNDMVHAVLEADVKAAATKCKKVGDG